MFPLLADAPPPDEPFQWPLLPVAAVTFSSAVLIILLDVRRDRRWAAAVRRRLGRRGLLVLGGVFLASTGGGGLYAVAISAHTPALQRYVIYAGGPAMIGVGLYFVLAAARNRPGQVDRLTRQFYGHVPFVPEPPPPPRLPTVSDEEKGFLAAIAAAPADDLPRLVYADWLDERNDPRGEFLRVEVAAYHGDDGAEERLGQLWHRFDPDWTWAVVR